MNYQIKWDKKRRFYTRLSRAFVILSLLSWTLLFFYSSTVFRAFEFVLIGLICATASFHTGTEAKTIERALERRGEGN
jgi:hypothetical protein